MLSALMPEIRSYPTVPRPPLRGEGATIGTPEESSFGSLRTMKLSIKAINFL